MTIDDLVGDTAALIEHLGDGSARVVGTSLVARIMPELARPDLVSQAVMMAAHGRRLRAVQAVGGGTCLYDAWIKLPSMYYLAILEQAGRLRQD